MITLGEVLPELAGGPHGQVLVGPAPRAGRTRVVRRRDIRRALRSAGLDAEGLHIPRSVRIRRTAREVDGERLRILAREAIADVVAPCTVVEVRPPRRLRVGPGELDVRAEPPVRLRDGRVSVALDLASGAGSQRVLVATRLSCPEPVVESGDIVRVIVRVGAVQASAPGRARQPGRVGEVIRIVNTATGARLTGRVVDADTVEVVR